MTPLETDAALRSGSSNGPGAGPPDGTPKGDVGLKETMGKGRSAIICNFHEDSGQKAEGLASWGDKVSLLNKRDINPLGVCCDVSMELVSGESRAIREVRRNQRELQQSRSPMVEHLTGAPGEKGSNTGNNPCMVSLREGLTKGKDHIIAQSEFGTLQGGQEALKGGTDVGDSWRQPMGGRRAINDPGKLSALFGALTERASCG